MRMPHDCITKECNSCPCHGSCLMERKMLSIVKSYPPLLKYDLALEIQQDKINKPKVIELPQDDK